MPYQTVNIGIRVSSQIAAEVRQIAARDLNGLSATVRRLLAIGLRHEGGQRGDLE